MGKKSLSEILEEVKHEKARNLLKERVSEYGTFDLDLNEYYDLRNVIDSCFIWEHTPENHIVWRNCSNQNSLEPLKKHYGWS